MSSPIAETPDPPYYAVIFTSIRTADDSGYALTAERMTTLAAAQDGYLGVESARVPELGITVSYWRDLESIAKWKAVGEHLAAQKAGKDRWYESFVTRIAKVERSYRFESTSSFDAVDVPRQK